MAVRSSLQQSLSAGTKMIAVTFLQRNRGPLLSAANGKTFEITRRILGLGGFWENRNGFIFIIYDKIVQFCHLSIGGIVIWGHIGRNRRRRLCRFTGFCVP